MRPHPLLPVLAGAVAVAFAANLAAGQSAAHAASGGPAVIDRTGSAITPVANYRHPYGNIDRRNDLGNDTGDSQIESLNEQQLNRNYRGPYYYPNGQAAPSPAAGYQVQPRAAYPAPPPGYPAPPPGYAAPPPGYQPPPGYPPPGYGAPPQPPGYGPPPRY